MITTQPLNSVITEVDKIFYLNLRNVLNKLYVFDEAEYKSIIEKDITRYSHFAIFHSVENGDFSRYDVEVVDR